MLKKDLLEVVEDVENEVEERDYKVEYEEVVERINRLYNKATNDYLFYKNIYLEHLDQDKISPRAESNYKATQKAIDNIKYYLHKYLDKNNEKGISDTQETDPEIESMYQ